MSLREAKMLAAELTIEDIRRLDEWLHARLNMLDEQEEERPKWPLFSRRTKNNAFDSGRSYDTNRHRHL